MAQKATGRQAFTGNCRVKKTGTYRSRKELVWIGVPTGRMGCEQVVDLNRMSVDTRRRKKTDTPLRLMMPGDSRVDPAVLSVYIWGDGKNRRYQIVR